MLAGPFATRILADMGADVVKINSRQRAVGTQDPQHPYYLMWNRNKRALALNLATDEGKEIAHALCEQADVVIDNFSAGVLDRWGVGYQAIHAVNKRAIYVQMSGMGDGGPWSKFVTYAPTIHALAGLTHTTGVTGREDIGLVFRTTIIKQACMGRSRIGSRRATQSNRYRPSRRHISVRGRRQFSWPSVVGLLRQWQCRPTGWQ
ncbi:MAG: hypothetical protein CM15mP120_20330 [Pseudomonadota bacterium]|nr:MAG: hypothetical protein CM15mP120_20330 [Pseudomonadota bacterium]